MFGIPPFGFWDGGTDTAIEKAYLGQTGIDRIPVEDRRIRRVTDALGRIRLIGLVASPGLLEIRAASVPEDGPRGGVYKLSSIADLNQTISDPPTQAEVQAISDKIDEMLAAMRVSEMLES